MSITHWRNSSKSALLVSKLIERIFNFMNHCGYLKVGFRAIISDRAITENSAQQSDRTPTFCMARFPYDRAIG